jgi:hypothetical protein
MQFQRAELRPAPAPIDAGLMAVSDALQWIPDTQDSALVRRRLDPVCFPSMNQAPKELMGALMGRNKKRPERRMVAG